MLKLALAPCLALALAACGANPSSLSAAELQAEREQAAREQASKTATSTSTATAADSGAPAAQSGRQATTVKVKATAEVEVTTGDAPAPGKAQPAQTASGSTRLSFAGGGFGYFFADGSFDRGEVLVQGQAAPGYCRFEAPACEGRCILDSLPVKYSLFTAGKGYVMAVETEYDMGRKVVSSVYKAGSCQAEVKTLQHSYAPRQAWTLDAGDSTVPAEHLAL